MSIFCKNVIALAFTVALLGWTPAKAEDFYHGKTVNLLVGYSAGGGYDINARLLARYLGRHIPGNPAVVVQNMPGAGTLRALEYLQRTAAKDGTYIDMFDYTQITNSLLTPDKVQIDKAAVDFRKFKWIGSMARDLAVCYVWHTSPVKTVADLQRLPTIPMGRTNPGSSSDVQQKILRKVFKVNVQSVAGYAGSAEAFIAVERGELNGGCMTWSSLPPNWIADKKITPVVRVSAATAPDLQEGIPSMTDVATNDHDRQVIKLLSAAGEIGKPFVVDLGVPDDRVEILRKGFDETMKDPEFIAEADKLRQAISPTTGLDAKKIVESIYASPGDIVDSARAVASD
jgi:tripartite-type tricarboxylate transporter receptor subunit TctC